MPSPYMTQSVVASKPMRAGLLVDTWQNLSPGRVSRQTNEALVSSERDGFVLRIKTRINKNAPSGYWKNFSLLTRHVPNRRTKGYVYYKTQNKADKYHFKLIEIADSYEEKFVYTYTGFNDQIKLMANLEHDWNTYGAEPPNQLSIQKAQRVLAELFRESFLPDRVLPSAEGGVGLVFLAQGKQADIEIFNDGEMLAGIYYADRETEIIELNDKNIKETAQIIHDFLY